MWHLWRFLFTSKSTGEVKAYNDDKIRADFATKFSVSMLYNKVVLWSLRTDEYCDSIMAWKDKMEQLRR